MFTTYPHAEFTFPPSLITSGERSWQWVELSVYEHIFYVNVHVELDRGDNYARHYLFVNTKDILGLIEETRHICKNLEIGLFSPGYMNGSGSYQFGRVKEIWEHTINHKQMFVMGDGSKIYSSTDEVNDNTDGELELIVHL